MITAQIQPKQKIPTRCLTFRNENLDAHSLSITCTSVEIDGKHTNLLDLSQMYEELKKEHDELKEMVLQLYYAPPGGGPGYIEAKLDFEEQLKLL